jgi:hypothetical protein
VKTLREGGDTPLLVRLTRPAVLGSAVGVVLLLGLMGVWIRNRRQHARKP